MSLEGIAFAVDGTGLAVDLATVDLATVDLAALAGAVTGAEATGFFDVTTLILLVSDTTFGLAAAIGVVDIFGTVGFAVATFVVTAGLEAATGVVASFDAVVFTVGVFGVLAAVLGVGFTETGGLVTRVLGLVGVAAATAFGTGATAGFGEATALFVNGTVLLIAALTAVTLNFGCVFVKLSDCGRLMEAIGVTGADAGTFGLVNFCCCLLGIDTCLETGVGLTLAAGCIEPFRFITTGVIAGVSTERQRRWIITLNILHLII